MKLNIGSNNVSYPGFKNVDIRPIPGVQIVTDVATLEVIKNESVEEIKAYNILEHFWYDETRTILKNWVSKLVPCGTIEIQVPEGNNIYDRYKKGISTRGYKDPWEDLIHSIFGNVKLLKEWHGEDAGKYGHKTLFCKSYLERLMQESGLHLITSLPSHHPDCFLLKGIKI